MNTLARHPSLTPGRVKGAQEAGDSLRVTRSPLVSELLESSAKALGGRSRFAKKTTPGTYEPLLVGRINNLTAQISDTTDRLGGVRARQAATDSAYATATQTAELLRSGAQYRRDRMAAPDMIYTDDAALLAGVSRVTINAWIKSGRCIGVAHLRRGFMLPRWQFEPSIWPALQPLAKNLGTSDGWQMLSFLESPATVLDGQTPRSALEQGAALDRILALAKAEAH